MTLEVYKKIDMSVYVASARTHNNYSPANRRPEAIKQSMRICVAKRELIYAFREAMNADF
jgi:hypothetical protein